VQIVTVHASKGLQYPIVYLPFLFDRWIPPVDVPRFHTGGERTLDIGGPGSSTFNASVKADKAESSGEQLRLLYVAATRAQSQIVAWWAPSTNAHNAGLARLLFGRKPGEADVPDIAPAPSDEDAVRILGEWQALGGPVVERVLPRDPAPVRADEPVGDLAIRRFDRVVDAAWRRTSYTGLTSDDHAATVGSEVPDVGKEDEEDAESVAPVEPSGPAVPSPMADLPMGAAFGNLVHGVLEQIDVTVPDLRAELATLARAEVGFWGVDVDIDQLADALVAVCRTPLGPLADDLTLETLLATRQLRELDFEMPLAGGDSPRARAAEGTEPKLGDMAALLEHHLAADDPMRAFADRLRSPGLAEQGLRGYLSGSIDLAVRLPDGRCLVVDYKTNWLGDFTEPLTLDCYTQAGLTPAMLSGTYPLQSLLYSVVMHRFLRWRQPGYDPATHLGGILYLYVRGMAGPETPRHDGQPAGVFAWHPPASLIEALSDLLDGVTS
jgi:exodeoxyribonuclease V beta subunit